MTRPIPVSPERPEGGRGAQRVCVVMHDVSPATWPECRLLLDALQQVAGTPHTAPLRATLLVVPAYHTGTAARDDRGFMDLMDRRRAAGDELALHGYRHYDDAVFRGVRDRLARGIYTAREGEFSALTYDEAVRRLRLGADWFAANGWPLKGFVAPAWLMNDASWRALETLPLAYTTTMRHFHSLPERNALPAQSLVYSARSGLRRAVSKIWNENLMRRSDELPFLRLGLHPIDARFPEIVRHWQDLLERALETRTLTTKADFAAELRDLVRYSSQTESNPIAAPTSAPPRTSLG
jgi:predicted deacetylase